jgi:CheY-like chemotaxis protein
MSSPNSCDVVIVEDNRAVAEVITAVLDEEGYRTRTFYDGRTALAALIAQPPALVLLDLDLPLLNGAELLATLRAEISSDLAVVIMTAGIRGQELLRHGATAVLSKPFDLDELLSCVARYVIQEAQGRSATQAL